MEDNDLTRHDLRWIWLALTAAGGTIATLWFAQGGGELYRSESDYGGIAGAAATTARFAVLLSLGAAAVDVIGMLSSKKTHTVPGPTSLVCAVAGIAALIATAVHVQYARIDFGYEADAWLGLAIGSMAALSLGGFGLWFDARQEHRTAERALAAVERNIHEVDHDIL